MTAAATPGETWAAIINAGAAVWVDDPQIAPGGWSP